MALTIPKQELESGGVLDMDTDVISTITSHAPGYLNKELEQIVGFQTEKPFKRAFMPYGGIRTAKRACEDNGYHVLPYHTLGVNKYEELGITYPLQGVSAATKQQANQAKTRILEEFKFKKQKQ